jgi:uncharacterized membrane protein YfcA
METNEILISLIAGFLAGVVNTLAGSGSLFTLPVLLFMGMPAHFANGTNRVGILTQTAVGAYVLRKRTGIKMKEDQWMILPVVAGSVAGALIAVEINEKALKYTIGGVMIILMVLTLMNYDKLLREHSETNHRPNNFLVAILLFAIGVYGGFIQAGVGILLLSLMLLLLRFNMNHANALKNLINFYITIPAFLIFAWHGHILWEIGLVIAVGQTSGAWIAARYAAGNKKAARWVRLLLLVMMAYSIFELLELRTFISL